MKTRKNRKQKILAVALIAGLIAILSMGSLAWFTAQDSVTNTIKLADQFSISVFEHDWTQFGTPLVGSTGVTYTNIMPGQKIIKDPTVKNTGVHPEYVRVHVTLSHYKEVWEQYFKQTGTDLTSILGGYVPFVWTRSNAPVFDEGENTVTYTFYLNSILNRGDLRQLFSSVTIPGDLTQDDVAAMKGGFTIKVVAEAIQAENLPEGVKTAQAAFALIDNK